MDVIVQTALTLRATFHLMYRATEGFLRGMFFSSSLTLCRLTKKVKFRPPTHPKMGNVLLIDGTGVHYLSVREWNQIKHGIKLRGRYVRVTITTDASTGIITNAIIMEDRGVGSGEISQIGALLDGQTPQQYSTLVEGWSVRQYDSI